ncbi:unnamed protein product, partial [Phaeothamnion confervicola]
VPPRVTNRRSAIFSFDCGDASCGAPEFSLDDASWASAGPGSTLFFDSLEDGVHTLHLRHLIAVGGHNELEDAEFSWTIDTVAPETYISTGPPSEGQDGASLDPFLFFTFTCSEPPCRYRYQFDEVVLEGEFRGPPLLGEVSLGLRAASSAAAADAAADSEVTQPVLDVKVFLQLKVPFHGGGGGGGGVDSDGGGDNGQATDSADGLPSSIVLYPVVEPSARLAVPLPKPVTDSSTGDTVFSLSVTRAAPFDIAFDGMVAAEILGNASEPLAWALLQATTTAKEWLRCPTDSPAEHLFRVSAVDQAGNVDTTPAEWQWALSSEPYTSIDTAPIAFSADGTARFVFSCALPKQPSAAARRNLAATAAVAAGLRSAEERRAADAPTPAPAATPACDYYFSLQGLDFAKLPPPGPTGEYRVSLSADSDGSTTSEVRVSSPALGSLLLQGLPDGSYLLKVCSCVHGTANCDRRSNAWQWTVDTAPPVTTILDFPGSLLPSAFKFDAGKPLSTFMCCLDDTIWRPCDAYATFELVDGPHSLVVLAADAAGRSGAGGGASAVWEVSLLDTVAQYCPMGQVRSGAARLGATATYNGRSCGQTMGCVVVYEL